MFSIEYELQLAATTKFSYNSQEDPWFDVGKNLPAGQVNPINPELYTILEDLYRDMMDYFDPEMVHMGGDYVS